MALDQYFSEIAKYPILSSDREQEAARAARAGDSASKELLIVSNLRLVVSIARRYSRDDILPDLIGEGNLALVYAADHYKQGLGARFSTYAFRVVERRIWSYLDKQNMIRLPQEQKALMRKIYRISNEYFVNKGEEPNPGHIADELNRQFSKRKYTRDDVNELLQMYNSIFVGSLNRIVGDEGDSERIDFIAGEDGTEIVGDLAGKSLADKVHVMIQELKIGDDDKRILEAILYERSGLDEIARDLKIRKEQVRQRYGRGLKFLRSQLSHLGISSNGGVTHNSSLGMLWPGSQQ